MTEPVPNVGRENLRRQVVGSVTAHQTRHPVIYVMLGFGLAAGIVAPILTWIIVHRTDPGVTGVILSLIGVSAALMALLWIRSASSPRGYQPKTLGIQSSQIARPGGSAAVLPKKPT